MLANYIKIAFRNLTRNLAYSVINMGGLSVGIAASLMIMLWVFDELSYDKFHVNENRLCQVWFNGNINGLTETWGEVPFSLYENLKSKHSRIKNVSVTDKGGAHLLSTEKIKIKREGRSVSPEFLEMFHFPLAHGTASLALDDPYSIVLSESTARALFGNEDPINKTVRIDDKSEARVTGVVKDVPSNSSIKFDFLMTFELFRLHTFWAQECTGDRNCDAFHIYVELQDARDLESVGNEIKYALRDRSETTIANQEVFLYPMDRWHLHQFFKNGKEDLGDRDDRGNQVFEFSIIAIGVLVVACINFMNLATARAERRAREVGVRKISGSRRKELIAQFLSESILLTAISFLLALAITELMLPLYNLLIQKDLSIDYTSPAFWLSAVGIVLATGIFSGSYPAFYLSSFPPAKVLKGKVIVGRESILPRKVLVVIQFAFSIFLIVGTIVVYRQIEFGRSQRLGYDKQFLITVPSNDGLKRNYKIIKDELTKTGVVVSSTKSNSPITRIYERNFMEVPHGATVNVNNIFAEYDYTKTMGINIIAGRDFLDSMASDSLAVVLNKTAAEILARDNPIGTKVTIAGQPLEIIGVIEDVRVNPFEMLQPLFIVLETEWKWQTHPQNITIRLSETRDVAAALKKVEAIFKKHNPAYPFEYSFVDEDFNAKFKTINLVGNLATAFAFIAIFIACLGLLGLAAFTTELRTKELGIRKVLGASVTHLISLISNDFIVLLAISFAMATPIAWWVSTNYLERYPLHIAFEWSILPITGISVLLVVLVIVCAQAMKVASKNPVENLRSE